MDQVNATILKTTIEAIPTLTEENFASWRTRITALFKLGGVKQPMLDGEPALDDDDNTILCAIILSKLSTNTQSNVVNSGNKDNAQLLWKAIINLENIKQRITHSRNGEEIKPDILFDHLEIHLNELKVSASNKSETIADLMFTNEDSKCTGDERESGLINTSCGMSTLRIEGKGSIQVKYKDQSLVFHNILLVPKITVNVISLRHLLLDQCNVNFDVNHFNITKNDELNIEGHYQNNLPVVKFELAAHQSHLSSAELLQKALGHVSFCCLRRKLGIPIKASETCKSCAVVKITKASFKH
ncbi:hypothetical protein VP01_2661g4 [Puccinia sorghi]|uniref:GAG-pre-integrase domain-containing protein n=1 Tax=Puccinia sorghi TaxID=27349 RepID=A0A0L6V3Z8_9BASI|nr:hypothetical protein VP01_2661g4 [Puccinia sorghi]